MLPKAQKNEDTSVCRFAFRLKPSSVQKRIEESEQFVTKFDFV